MKCNVVDHEFVFGYFFIIEDKSSVPDVRQCTLKCQAVEIVGEKRCQTIPLHHVISFRGPQDRWSVVIHVDFI